jgi:hypothetical protein
MYNIGMDILPFDESLSKRMIADAMRTGGLRTVLTADNRKKTYYDALADMIWQGIVEGEIIFADGSHFVIPELKEGPKIWLDLVKFVAGHLDGGVGVNAQFNTVNVFKVYQGIEVDRV